MEHEEINIPILSLLPFILMLLSIALLPLFWNRFWERNRNKLIIALILNIPVTIYLLAGGFSYKLLETLVFDYIPFIILPGALFQAVAEENNIMMPDFFSYMVKFSLIILLPVFVIVQFIIF